MDKLTIDDFKKMLRNALVCITEHLLEIIYSQFIHLLLDRKSVV